ncbi:MAG: zinc ribbon domain-containing protein [Planctomycetes bacterium]|nr:zinc ribbon domain-containing protein [Planctomycetota bacterium]
MPTYEYIAVNAAKACDHCRAGFEVRQRMSDEPLKNCPQCGNAVQRVISAVGISTRKSTKSLLSDENIKKHGFTRLVKEDEGKYRKI